MSVCTCLQRMVRVHIRRTSVYACVVSLQSFQSVLSEARLTIGSAFVTLSSRSLAPTKGRNCPACRCFVNAAGLDPARVSPYPNSSNELRSTNFISNCLSLPPRSRCPGLYVNVLSKRAVHRRRLFLNPPVVRIYPNRSNIIREKRPFFQLQNGKITSQTHVLVTSVRM